MALPIGLQTPPRTLPVNPTQSKTPNKKPLAELFSGNSNANQGLGAPVSPLGNPFQTLPRKINQTALNLLKRPATGLTNPRLTQKIRPNDGQQPAQTSHATASASGSSAEKENFPLLRPIFEKVASKAVPISSYPQPKPTSEASAAASSSEGTSPSQSSSSDDSPTSPNPLLPDLSAFPVRPVTPPSYVSLKPQSFTAAGIYPQPHQFVAISAAASASASGAAESFSWMPVPKDFASPSKTLSGKKTPSQTAKSAYKKFTTNPKNQNHSSMPTIHAAENLIGKKEFVVNGVTYTKNKELGSGDFSSAFDATNPTYIIKHLHQEGIYKKFRSIEAYWKGVQINYQRLAPHGFAAEILNGGTLHSDLFAVQKKVIPLSEKNDQELLQICDKIKELFTICFKHQFKLDLAKRNLGYDETTKKVVLFDLDAEAADEGIEIELVIHKSLQSFPIEIRKLIDPRNLTPQK